MLAASVQDPCRFSFTPSTEVGCLNGCEEMIDGRTLRSNDDDTHIVDIPLIP
jgi:hypothetical protein